MIYSKKTRSNRKKNNNIIEIKQSDSNRKKDYHNNTINNAIEIIDNSFSVQKKKQINANEKKGKNCNINRWDKSNMNEKKIESELMEENIKTTELEKSVKMHEIEKKKRKKKVDINVKIIGSKKQQQQQQPDVIEISDEENVNESLAKKEEKKKNMDQMKRMEYNTFKGKRGKRETRITENQIKLYGTLKKNGRTPKKSKTNILDYISHNENEDNNENKKNKRTNGDDTLFLDEFKGSTHSTVPFRCFLRTNSTPTTIHTASESMETKNFNKKKKTSMNIPFLQLPKRKNRYESSKSKNVKKRNSFEQSTKEVQQKNEYNGSTLLDKYDFLRFVCSPPKTALNSTLGERRKSTYTENLNYIKKNMEAHLTPKKERKLKHDEESKKESSESENNSEDINIWEESIFFHKQKKRRRKNNSDKQKYENRTEKEKIVEKKNIIQNKTTEVVVIEDDNTDNFVNSRLLKENRKNQKNDDHHHISKPSFSEVENTKFCKNAESYVANFTENADNKMKEIANNRNIFEDYWNSSTAKKEYPYSEESFSPLKKKNDDTTNYYVSVDGVDGTEKKKETETEMEEERKEKENEKYKKKINQEDRNYEQSESSKERSSSDNDLKENGKRNMRMWKPLYRYLGVSVQCTEEMIKKAYKEKIKIYHPDKGGNIKKFLKLKMSYDILSNKKKRKLYDKYGNSVLEMLASDKYVDCSVSSEEKSDEEELVELEECSQIFDLFVAKYYHFSYLNNLGDLKINGDQYNEFQNLVFHLFTMENKIFKNLFFIYPAFSPYITPLRRTKKLKDDEQFIADREMEREELFANAFDEINGDNCFYSTSEISPLVFRMTKEMKSIEKSKMKKKVSNIFNTLQSEFTFFCNQKKWRNANAVQRKPNEDPFYFSNECRTPNHYDTQAQWKHTNDKDEFFNNPDVQESTKMEVSPLASKIRNESNDKLLNDFCKSFDFFFESEKDEYSCKETEKELNNTKKISTEFPQHLNKYTIPSAHKNKENYECNIDCTPTNNSVKKCYRYNWNNVCEENEGYQSLGMGETGTVTPSSSSLKEERKGKRGRKKKQNVQQTRNDSYEYKMAHQEPCYLRRKENNSNLSFVTESYDYISNQSEKKYSFSLNKNSPNGKRRSFGFDNNCVQKKNSSPNFNDRINSITVEEKYGFHLHKKGDIKIDDVTQCFNYIYIGNSRDKKKKYILFLKEESMQHFLQIKLLLKEIKENKQQSNLKLVSIYENLIDRHLKNIEYLLLLITDKEEQIPLSDFYLLDKIKFLEQLYCIPIYIKKNTVTRPNFHHIKWIIYTLQSLVYFFFF